MAFKALSLAGLLTFASAASVGPLDVAHLKHRAFVPTTQDLSPQLTQQQTNGLSKLGTLEADRLPEFRTGCAAPGTVPWGNRTAASGNNCGGPPTTGCIRQYNFTITQQQVAPDGVSFQGLLVNGQFPGPTIEANWGDIIQVTVNNGMPAEGVALHWHGLLQKGTVWEDGVPSIQQCPIPPGESFTYQYQADMFGTTWYHSHYSAQYAGGMFGALIIYGPHDNADYDEDLGPVILNDWYHEQYYNLLKLTMAPTASACMTPHSSNVLINGKMNYNCAAGAALNHTVPCANQKDLYKPTSFTCTPNAGVSKFRFQSGKKYRLRLINSGAQSTIKFSIDNHQLLVFANDFVPIVPYNTTVVTLGIGQRSDVVVTATGHPTDAVWMRADVGPSLPVGCGLNDNTSTTGMAAVYYEKANTNAVPKTQSQISFTQLTTCENDDLSLTVPLCSQTPPQQVAWTQNVNVTLASNGTHRVFKMNNQTFRGNYNHPILLNTNKGNTTFEPEWNVYNFGSNSSIRFIVYNNAAVGNHPFHMHGHNFWVIDQGFGTYNGSTINAKNPQRRDVQLLPPMKNISGVLTQSYIVLQINTDNPGTWPFHCHIAWHVSNGLYLTILEQTPSVQKLNIPTSFDNLCTKWNNFSATHVVPQIDSGLKLIK